MPQFTIAEVLIFFKKFGYPIMFLGSFIEGVSVMLLGGFFAARGYFSFSLVWLAMFLGDVLGDVMWYYVGYFGGTRIIGKIEKIFKTKLKEKSEKMKKFLEERGGRIIIGIKFTAGLCFAMLITTGTVKMKFKKFLKYDVLGSIGWVSLMCGLGYFFGESYDLLDKYVKRMGFVVTGMVIAAFIIVKVIRMIAGKAEGIE